MDKRILKKESHKSENGRYERLSISLMAVFVGLLTGLCGMLFNWLLDWLHDFLFGSLAGAARLGDLKFFLLPLAGGVLIGMINRFGIGRAQQGCGVTEVIEELKNISRFLMKPKAVLIKMLGTLITLSSGLSAGRHGPIVHLGGAIGSNIGYRAGFSKRKIRILIGCGVAGSLSGVFDAPVFAALFVMEVLMNRDFFEYFTPIFIASITSAFLGRAVVGHTPFLSIAGTYGFKDYREILFYVGLGLVMGLLSVLYIEGLHGTRRFFDRSLKIPFLFKPILGAALVGLIGYRLPLIYDIEFDTIARIVEGEFGIRLLALLVAAKLAATFLTLGSGGIGGVFVPGLFIGAAAGGVYGGLLERFFPSFIYNADTYAIIGIGAIFAGFAEAPISAALMVAELTDNYTILFPSLIACAVGSITTEILHRYSIYTHPLRDNLIRID